MARQAGLALLLAAAAVPAGALRHYSKVARGGMSLRNYRFRDFVVEYGRKYEEGSQEYLFREQLFNGNKQHIVEFNEGPKRGWRIGVNKFMDYTQAEKRSMLGYTGSRSRRHTGSAGAIMLKESRQEPVPTEFMVRKPKSKLLDVIRDQGSCGSCWAQAAVSVLEGQLEATSGVMEALADLRAKNASNASVPTVPTLSSQTIVSCTKNPRNCGGTGGCGGATVELAYGMIHEQGGLPFAVDWPYESGEGDEVDCQTGIFAKSMISISGYTVLPSNKQHPLKQALVNSGGPIAVSVDASGWFLYFNGIYSDTQRGGDFTVNHAVALVGYSDPRDEAPKEDEDPDWGFWKIKNSWGELWGEDGYIRIEMKANEDSHCGWDRSTHDGVACDGDPDEAWVCGSCGILYDSVFPTGVRLK